MSEKKSFESPKSGVIPVSVSLQKEVFDARDLDHQQSPITKRVLYLSLQAIANAVVIGVIAKVLVAIIDLVTNISFYGRFSFASADPSNQMGWTVIFVPVIGGLIVGLMARYGNAGIRGHGIPEAMEQVLVNESRISPIIMFLKPISAAIAIGTGGPFGAEGPIIATGGALGSVAGQTMRITANERKIILTAGACAGMSAIFGSPVAGVLLAIELLLFEFSPRSIIPVALSCATGAAAHLVFFGSTPVFSMPDIPAASSIALITYVIFGVIIGIGAALVSKSVYLVEDLFDKLPIHWMWWPAIGAIAVGVIGFYAPHTMGVGYDNIRHLLSGNLPVKILLVFCFLKFISWAISLGSGTSGGTLAPLFTIGGAFGCLLGILALKFFPGCGINLQTAALIGMAAMFAGASRALLTSIVFAMETTMEPHGLLPLLGACTAAYFVSFFLMKGTIMTEKIERRGVHTPVSYQPDILEKMTVKEVMEDEAHVLSAENTLSETREWLKIHEAEITHSNFVLVGKGEHLIGMVSRSDIFNPGNDPNNPIAILSKNPSLLVHLDNTLSVAVDQMERHDTDVLPVVSREDPETVVGILTHKNIITAYGFRRKEDEIYKRAFSLRRRGIKIIVRGKQFFRWQK